MLEFDPIPIPGAYLIRPKVVEDDRGTFVKIFHRAAFEDHGIHFAIAESFYSTSYLGVVRGMHFQSPPAAHDKLVHCTSGRALDVLLDLRAGSPMYGKFFSAELSARSRKMLFIPVGVAHGFLALEERTTLGYSVTTAHEPNCDMGVRWDSFGFDWPVEKPLLSQRDRALPTLASFTSPFLFQP